MRDRLLRELLSIVPEKNGSKDVPLKLVSLARELAEDPGHMGVNPADKVSDKKAYASRCKVETAELTLQSVLDAGYDQDWPEYQKYVLETIGLLYGALREISDDQS